MLPAVEPAVYEAEEQNPITKLKINNQDIDVTRYISVLFLYKKKKAVVRA